MIEAILINIECSDSISRVGRGKVAADASVFDRQLWDGE
jgi:hypothetical protein